jgi:hypothetical protein
MGSTSQGCDEASFVRPTEDLALRTDCILISLHGVTEDSLVSKAQFGLSVCYCLLHKTTFLCVCSVLSYNQCVMFMLSVIYHHEYISNTPVSLKQYHSLVLLPKYKFYCKRLVEHFIYGPYKLLRCCPFHWIL